MKVYENVQTKTTTINLLCWSLGDAQYALPLDACREVDQGRRVASVARATGHIAGIVNLRGDVVPVIDLRVLFGFTERSTVDDSENVVIRVKTPQHGFALLAGGAADVLSIASTEIQPPPANLTEQARRFTAGVVSTSSGVVTILNHDALLSLEDERKIAQ